MKMAPLSITEIADSNEIVLKLPHPYRASYSAVASSHKINDSPLFQLRQTNKGVKQLPQPLHNNDVYFTELADLESSYRPPESNNTPWARARRSPSTTITWSGVSAPTLPQIWLLVYALLTVKPDAESFRLRLVGQKAESLSVQIKAVSLAIAHPTNGVGAAQNEVHNELVVLRSTFWQGAGSPFGPRPVWAPEDPGNDSSAPLCSFPPTPLDYTMTVTDPNIGVLAWHPRRPAKPKPGSVIYSRYIPHLKETFSMVSLDYTNNEHLNLFHTWQNDPRVAQGWNETGTLEQHREYLRKIHEDPHQITVLAQFDDVHFAYFEIYWGKVRLFRPYLSLIIRMTDLIVQ